MCVSVYLHMHIHVHLYAIKFSQQSLNKWMIGYLHFVYNCANSLLIYNIGKLRQLGTVMDWHL